MEVAHNLADTPYVNCFAFIDFADEQQAEIASVQKVSQTCTAERLSIDPL